MTDLKELETLAGDLNLDFDSEDLDQFSRDLAEHIENEYRWGMERRNAKGVIPADIHEWAGDYAWQIVNGQADATAGAIEEGIAEGVEADCDDAEEIIKGDELEALYDHFRDDGEEGFKEWCKFELGEDQPEPEAYYCMKRRDNISKKLDFNAVSIGDRHIWMHPRSQVKFQ